VKPRRASAWLVTLAVAALGAQVLQMSAQRLYPHYDEVRYLAISRDFAREGGIARVIRCYWEGRCTEGNRPPLYQFFIAPIIDDNPQSFADAKLVEHGMALLLIAVVGLVAARVFSPRVGVGSAIAVTLMSLMPEYGARLMHDLLYSALTFAAIYAFASWQERGFGHWLAAGALVGLAFLTKGSGHLLWVGLVSTSFYKHRFALFRRPILYAAACGFVLVSCFFLVRNVKVYGSPFYNFNAPQIWLNKWRDVWAMKLTPEYNKAGLSWYLQHHTFAELAAKIGRGVVLFIGLLCYSSGLLFQNQVARVVPGVALLVLAGFGLRRRWKTGRRVEVVAVLSTLAFYFAALSVAASGATELQARYQIPYIVTLIPYAVFDLLERVWPWLRARIAARVPRVDPTQVALAALALFLTARFALAAPAAFARNPRTLWAVEPHWHETSLWLASHLGPGERFAMPYQSYYSTWDAPRPDTDAMWPFWYATPAAEMLGFMQQEHVRKVLVDREAAESAGYPDKLSLDADAHGSLAFLGWPRCFDDGASPSRFLIYCKPAVGGGSAAPE
jgi:4-amino-4-deoxy-L-arabinose transferase-like glycosyltransferase